MSSRKNKKDLTKLPQDQQEHLHKLREKEKELLDKSGYLIWRKKFIYSYLSYSSIYVIYLIMTNKFNTDYLKSYKYLLCLFIPSIPIGIFLTNKYFNSDLYSEYFKTHIELNRYIKLYLK